ncbi:ABC transporter permease, partial [Mesorhizobium sp. WSM3879]|uniref:ABC transporter permease n=1 Tax=Mesorhizobium sp. WSM3879 TaxID=2029406 RepID=UPI000BAF8561
MFNIRQIPLAALIGLLLTGLAVIGALFAQWIAPHGNGEIVGDVWVPMSSAHWLGTDNLGRDLLSRMIYGARITIFIAGMATALSFSLGAILGFTAAVVGGLVDTLMSGVVDLLMAIPTLIFGLVILAVLPANNVTLILVMGILSSTRVYRLSRAVAADINAMDFVEAAKLRGEGLGWIIFREILPNAM